MPHTPTLHPERVLDRSLERPRIGAPRRVARALARVTHSPRAPPLLAHAALQCANVVVGDDGTVSRQIIEGSVLEKLLLSRNPKLGAWQCARAVHKQSVNITIGRTSTHNDEMLSKPVTRELDRIQHPQSKGRLVFSSAMSLKEKHVVGGIPAGPWVKYFMTESLACNSDPSYKAPFHTVSTQTVRRPSLGSPLTAASLPRHPPRRRLVMMSCLR